MKKFFIHDGQNQLGPLDLQELKSQSLKRDTPVWFEGLESWTTAEKIEELKGFFENVSTPPPFNSQNLKTNINPPPIPTADLSYPIQERKKKTLLIPIIIGGVIIAAGIIGWLIYQNQQQKETINEVQEQVSTQQTEAQQKEIDKQNVNAAITQKNLNYRNNWDRYIKVEYSSPEINYGLGGISAFNVYVTNQTDYILDEVDVLIQYIRKSGELYKSETVRLFNVPKNSRESGVAPSSINGVKVSVIITKILSQKMHFCYPVSNGNATDPYFCR